MAPVRRIALDAAFFIAVLGCGAGAPPPAAPLSGSSPRTDRSVGRPDAGTVAEEHCAAAECPCNANSCPSGCCSLGTCMTPTVALCGPPGAACEPCDPTVSDRCGNGECRCGDYPPCGIGEHCENGSCLCDPTSCGGCCVGYVCEPGFSSRACGVGGVSCITCTIQETCCPDLGCCSGGCTDPTFCHH